MFHFYRQFLHVFRSFTKGKTCFDCILSFIYFILTNKINESTCSTSNSGKYIAHKMKRFAHLSEMTSKMKRKGSAGCTSPNQPIVKFHCSNFQCHREWTDKSAISFVFV